MDNKIYLGIDIGKKGGICFLDPNNPEIKMQAIPLNNEGELDIFSMYSILIMYPNIHVVFEYLTPLHLASKKSNWSLSFQAGAIEALCIAMKIPFSRVPPKVWQKKMFEKLPPLRKESGSSDTKELALIAVKILYPDLKLPCTPRSKTILDGVVDSVLLATYGKQLNL